MMMGLLSFLWGRDGDIQIGDKAPDFRLMDQDSVFRSLSDYAGRFIIVYFYPKDGTPG